MSRLIYGSILGDTRHNFRTGLSFTLDHYNEQVGVFNDKESFDREENGLGAFFEYNYDDLNDFTMNLGLRIDNNNLLGTFVTPRLNARYTPWEKAELKASIG